MPQDYAEGHPLRKDFPLRGRFSRAEQTRRALAQDVERFYGSETLGRGRRATAGGGTVGVSRGSPLLGVGSGKLMAERTIELQVGRNPEMASTASRRRARSRPST